MTPLLEQFLSEAREFLQGIGEKLMELERAPADAGLMNELFRLVHTLKGSSGLFDFPEMTRVLHAGEDLMDAVRDGRVAYSRELADVLLDAMDFVGMLRDEVEAGRDNSAQHAANAVRLAEALRRLIPAMAAPGADATPQASGHAPPIKAPATAAPTEPWGLPEAARMDAYRRALAGETLFWLAHTPAEECFFQGDDPFFRARQTPGLIWGKIEPREPWPRLAELDAYRCVLDFHMLVAAPRAALDEHYRYVPDQIRITALAPLAVVFPWGEAGAVPPESLEDARALMDLGRISALIALARERLARAPAKSWAASAWRWLLLVLEIEPDNHIALDGLLSSLENETPPVWNGLPDAEAASSTDSADSAPGPAGTAGLAPELAAAAALLLANQREILSLPVSADWHRGRLLAAAEALSACGKALALPAEAQATLQSARESAVAQSDGAPLLAILKTHFAAYVEPASGAARDLAVESSQPLAPVALAQLREPAAAPPAEPEPEIKFGRRAEDNIANLKSLRVDQTKIDRLMNLIGEMVVARNALPYLAGRAEAVFGVRELSREIKAQHAVINRIVEEMQDAIMQVRMMPVSFVFQRFPRLVRDTARKLGKEVNLLLEGEDTEADKNVIEALADPLMHIVRNALDHGIEAPDVRRAAGKPAAGTLTLRASQESDRVVIEIRDDGKGIDPQVVKRKAYEKGLIDEATLERITDQEAIQLIFAPGFSTAEAVTDLSGRGVGMDVVNAAVTKVNGSVALDSESGRGTRIRLSVPLSMAVSNVMVIESDGQIFGVPMDCVVETVRVPRGEIRRIKTTEAVVLRGRVIPLKSLNSLLGLGKPPVPSADDELAVLVVRVGDEPMGLLVDDFRETVDIILKPMAGVLAGLSAYSGSALLGDGSVLMVLNVKELI